MNYFSKSELRKMLNTTAYIVDKLEIKGIVLSDNTIPSRKKYYLKDGYDVSKELVEEVENKKLYDRCVLCRKKFIKKKKTTFCEHCSSKDVIKVKVKRCLCCRLQFIALDDKMINCMKCESKNIRLNDENKTIVNRIKSKHETLFNDFIQDKTKIGAKAVVDFMIENNIDHYTMSDIKQYLKSRDIKVIEDRLT